VAPTEAFPRARAAAQRALEIDPVLSEARTVMAMIKGSLEHDLKGAEREARAAIEGHPTYPRARQALTEVLSVQERFDERWRRSGGVWNWIRSLCI
jgi:Flp pilus assembly protein TadD